MPKKHPRFTFTILTDLKGPDIKAALERLTRRLKAVGLPFQICDGYNLDAGEEYEEAEILKLLGFESWGDQEGGAKS